MLKTPQFPRGRFTSHQKFASQKIINASVFENKNEYKADV